ncbi:MAG TPA: hypothetical protein VMH23_11690 [Bacteroidota bacterium]|nr:hypothetical protein [Bacteroidota bacterium]
MKKGLIPAGKSSSDTGVTTEKEKGYILDSFIDEHFLTVSTGR